MLKHPLPEVPRGAEPPLDDDMLPFAYEELDQRFWGLLDDEDLDEAFSEFQVDVTWPG